MSDKSTQRAASEQPIEPQLPISYTPKAVEARFEERADALQLRRRVLAGELLQQRYDVGLFAKDLVDDKTNPGGKRAYGQFTIKNLADRLEETTSTVYACMRFVRKFDKPQLEAMKDKEWPWSAVVSLVGVEDPEELKQLKDDYEEGKYENRDKFKEAVTAVKLRAKQVASGKKPRAESDRGPGADAAISVKSLKTLLHEALSTVIPQFIAGVKEFQRSSQKMQPGTVASISNDVKDVRQHIANTQKLFGRAAEVIRESGIV